MLRFLTAGESHGRALTVIVDGLPAGLVIDESAIAAELARRQLGYGRGRRMAIERDRAQILSGVRRGETIGAPVSLLIENKDWPNWQHTMSVEREPAEDAGGARRAAVTRPRPGHADLAGGLKFDRADLRDVLERASARETAARVAAGTLARILLAGIGVRIVSHVFRVGGAGVDDPSAVTFEQAAAIPAESDLHCTSPEDERAMVAAIDRAKDAGDTLGGAFELIARGAPAGLGSYTQWDSKLDGRIGQALMSVHAIKAVGIGAGTSVASRPGSAVHDEIVTGDSPTGLTRPTNRAGGIEGGVTNGEDIRVSAYMKPISTLMKPLRSVDLSTGEPSPAVIERSDVCAISAAAVVGEAGLAWVLAGAVVEKFGGDTMGDLQASLDAYRSRIGRRLPTRTR
ncbi:MAG: chorismate synthase [Acidobacteriota bacterium]|nr:chorismate synthase [Acidobacteriota bacterium]